LDRGCGLEREKIGGVGQWTFFCLCLEENVLLRFLANGATTKRDASPRTTMMMESRDTQILSDLPPRCDVDDDDDDDASIVFVVVLSEEEEDRRRRERPRDPLRSSNDASKRDTIDRLSKTISSRRHIEEGPFLFFSKGRPPSMIKQNSFLSSEKKKRERDREIRTFTDATPPLAATDDDILLVLLLLLLFLNESLTNDALVVVLCRVSSSSSFFGCGKNIGQKRREIGEKKKGR
jgi:hypothetical protein